MPGCCCLLKHHLFQRLPQNAVCTQLQLGEASECIEGGGQGCCPVFHVVASQIPARTSERSTHACAAISRPVLAHSQLPQACQLLQGRGQGCHAIRPQVAALKVQAAQPCQALQGWGQGRSCLRAFEPHIQLPEAGHG